MKFATLIALVASASAVSMTHDAKFGTCAWVQTTPRDHTTTPSGVARGTCSGTNCLKACTNCPESDC